MRKVLIGFGTALFCLAPIAQAADTRLPELSVPFLSEFENQDPDLSHYLPKILPEANKSILVDIANQRLCINAYGLICAKEYPISTGANDHPTPKGEFKVQFKEKLRISRLDKEARYRMPHYMAFTRDGGYGFHALPYLGNDATGSAYWYEARSHIGIPVSHGCVRILPEDAQSMFFTIPVGTPVHIE